MSRRFTWHHRANHLHLPSIKILRRSEEFDCICIATVCICIARLMATPLGGARRHSAESAPGDRDAVQFSTRSEFAEAVTLAAVMIPRFLALLAFLSIPVSYRTQ